MYPMWCMCRIDTCYIYNSIDVIRFVHGMMLCWSFWKFTVGDEKNVCVNRLGVFTYVILMCCSFIQYSLLCKNGDHLL